MSDPSGPEWPRAQRPGHDAAEPSAGSEPTVPGVGGQQPAGSGSGLGQPAGPGFGRQTGPQSPHQLPPDQFAQDQFTPDQFTPDQLPPDQFPSSQPTAPIAWTPLPSIGTSTPVEPTVLVPPPAGPTRSRHPARVIGIVVIAVLVVLFAADRITPIVVGRAVGENLQSELGTPDPPQVRFSGFPFLTQLATQNFSQIEVTAHDVSSAQLPGAITVRTITAQLHGVDVSDDRITIDSADGSALLDYQAVSTLVGHNVTYAGDNRVKIRLLAEIAITAAVTVDQQQGQITLTDVRIDSSNAPGFANELVERIVNTLIPPLSLPEGIRLTGVQVEESGVWAQGTGSNLTMPR